MFVGLLLLLVASIPSSGARSQIDRNGLEHKVELFALTSDYRGPNNAVHIDTTSGNFSVVVRNFSTWNIPTACFDTASNTFWAAVRVADGSERLKLVAFSAESGNELRSLPLSRAYKPDNIDGMHFDANRKLVHLLHTPFNETTSHVEIYTISVSAETGREMQRIPMPVGGLTENLGSDAFDSERGMLFHLWTDGTTTTQVLSIVDVRTPGAAARVAHTNLSRYDYLADPVFVAGGGITGSAGHEAGSMVGVNSGGYVVALDVASGAVRQVSAEAMLHGPGPWHGVVDRQKLYITNTTQGEPAPPPVAMRATATAAAREAQMRATRKLMRTRGAETLPQMLQKDVDNTTLLVFDLGTGHLLRSEPLARPVVWMGLLQ